MVPVNFSALLSSFPIEQHNSMLSIETNNCREFCFLLFSHDVGSVPVACLLFDETAVVVNFLLVFFPLSFT